MKKDYKLTKNHQSTSTDVSVIISLYNYQDYINKAVDSVLKNGFSSIEIVIVNDCSTDNSLSKVLPYLETTHKFTIIDKFENTGLVETRNLGIDLCVGEFVFILDADNEIYTDCIEKHYRTLVNTNMIACYGEIDCIDESGSLVRKVSNQEFDINKLKKYNYIDAMAMFNKSKLIEIGKYDTEIIKHGIGWEDYELWLRIGNLGLEVAFIKESLSKYLIKEMSMLVLTNSYLDSLKKYLNTKYDADI